MKQYFAKYLPVEGEIKEREGIFPSEDDFVIGGTNPPVKKKLFLCSRDIQVGDKFHHDIYGQTFTCTSKEVSIIREEKRQFFVNHCYKLIGEISPEATWVKDGDEIEDFETQMFFKHNNKWYKEEQKGINLQEKKYFKIIKGPCGRFH